MKFTNNENSPVAVITVNVVMQRAMTEMGLRVLSTAKDRQYGNPQARHNGKGRHNNSEPVKYMFRCYGCFEFEEDTNRVYCRWCGNKTYQRVAIYEDENGKHHYRYFARDRFGGNYLQKHSLIPKGSQLVKDNGKGNAHNYAQGHHGNRKKKKKKKKRASLSGDDNNR